LLRTLQITCAVLLVSIYTSAEKGLNPEIWFARSVIVTAHDGRTLGNIYDSKIPMDERTIVAEVEDRFRKWGRYHVVTHLEDADIVVVVRKGSRVSIEAPAGSRIPGTGPVVDVRGTGDLFAIYQGRTDEPLRGPVLWSDIEKDGLRTPELKAFQRFKKQVEEAEKPAKP